MSFSAADDYADDEFIAVNCSKQLLSKKTFEECRFERCDFSETEVAECKFIDCRFSECNFSLLKVPGSRFRSVEFDECKALGIDWTRASWPRFGTAGQLKFSGCNLSDSSFFGLALEECVFEHCKARDVDFREANLTGARCCFTDFGHALFGKTILSGADFSDAEGYDIDVFDNQIVGAKFSRTEALRLLLSLKIDLAD